MEKSELQNGIYRSLLAQFKTHLQTLNYSKGTVKSSQINTKDFLLYLENKQIDLLETNTKTIADNRAVKEGFGAMLA